MKRNEIIFILHIFIYTFGYGMVSFAYMPYLYHENSNQYLMGMAEFLLTLSNLILPVFFILDPKTEYVKYFIIYATLSTGIYELLIPDLYLYQIIFMFLLVGLSQFLWWYSTELFMVFYLKDSTIANYYSFTWGISFLITPYISSYIIHRMGFIPVFYIGSIIIIISSLIFLKLIKTESIGSIIMNKKSRIDIIGLLPTLSSGLVLSLIFSIFSYILLSNGYTIVMLGIVFSFVSFGRIAGFFLSIFVRTESSLRISFIISFAMMMLISIPTFTLNFYLISLSSFLVAMGSSLGISLPLIEISMDKSIDSGKSIAVYELFFGIGISLFSLIGGFLAQCISSRFPYIFYMIIIISLFLIFLIEKYLKKLKRVQ